MMVYSVFLAVDYEGFDPQAVFASREQALAFIRSAGVPGIGQYCIIASELGQPIDVMHPDTCEWL